MIKTIMFRVLYGVSMVRYFVIFTMLLISTVSVKAETGGLKSLETTDHGQIWSAVGRLTLDGGRGFCTASLIAPDIILTAAHCLYDKETGIQYGTEDFEFQAGWRNGRGEAFRKVKSVLAHPKYSFQSVNMVEKVSQDIAVVLLEEPIRSENIKPFIVAPLPQRGDGVAVVSYAMGRKDVPSIQSLCEVRAEQDDVLLLTCDVDYGASGAPVFVMSDGTAVIVSLISAMTFLGDEKLSLGVALQETLNEFAHLVRRYEMPAPSISSSD
jgi:V8-like Glu-specific endopeptidase